EQAAKGRVSLSSDDGAFAAGLSCVPCAGYLRISKPILSVFSSKRRLRPSVFYSSGSYRSRQFDWYSRRGGMANRLH
ncbi:MAG TPA: hypothetical protein VFZ10_13090, partial [Geminicoccaceae bacterium]